MRRERGNIAIRLGLLLWIPFTLISQSPIVCYVRGLSFSSSKYALPPLNTSTPCTTHWQPTGVMIGMTLSFSGTADCPQIGRKVMSGCKAFKGRDFQSLRANSSAGNREHYQNIFIWYLHHLASYLITQNARHDHPCLWSLLVPGIVSVDGSVRIGEYITFRKKIL